MTYQSAAPTNVASGGGNGAAIYTTTLWQDSDDFLIRYWDGDSWELIGGGTDLTFSGTSSPVTLNSSTGTDVTFTAGGINSFSATGTNITITATEVDGSTTNEGSLTVGAGTGTTSIINSNTSGSTGVTLTAGTGLSISEVGNVITLANTGLTGSGTDNQFAYWNSGALTSTINARYDVANVVSVFAPTGFTVDASYKLNAEALYLRRSGPMLRLNTGGATDGRMEFQYNSTAVGGINIDSDGFGGLLNIYANFGNRFAFTGANVGINETNPDARLAIKGGGSSNSTWTQIWRNSSNTFGGGVRDDGLWGIGNTTNPQRTLHVTGEVRITDLTTDTPTRIVGADADGDLAELALSGMSISSGTLTATDGSTTNELQTIANTSNSTSHTATLSSSGGSLQIIEGAGVLLTTGGTGLNGTVTIEAIDPSTTNEIQTLSASGAGPTSYNIDLTSSGTSVTLSEGTGIDLTRSGNTITVASTAASAWLLDGNTITSAKRIGSNDNFDVVVETNGTDRVWFDNSGPVSIGATQLTTAALNINGLQGGIGQLIAGGSGLVTPSFYQATGSGSGSTATVFSGVISMLNGNVESLIQNTSTSGTGGVVMQLNAKTATGDPRLYMTIDGTTDWSIGIDNDDVDNLKLHRFAAPSDNNGEGTIEFGYDGTMIGMGINKTGIGTATNGYYALDIFGKTRADQFVNNRYDITSTPVATMAVGTAAGTSPTVDNTVTSVWGNAARLKFTSGSSPTANGVVCTITLGTEYTFNECIPIMQGRSTNAGAFNYSCSYDSGTRVITCTLVGTLTASTVYEFNIIFLGRN